MASPDLSKKPRVARPCPALTAHLIAVLIALALNVHLRSAGRLGFYGDDYPQMVAFLVQPEAAQRPWGNLLSHVASDEPLFNVYHALRYRILGDAPRPHHLFLAGLLTVNACLAFSLIWRLSGNFLLAFLFLFLFLTYPHRGEAHYWPAAVYVPLLCLLLVACHTYLSWLRSGRRVMLAAACLSYAQAVFTHETAFGFVGVLAAVWALERRPGLSFRGALHCLSLPLATNAAYLILRQTQAFGHLSPGLSPDRPLETSRLLPNLFLSVRTTFGEPFVSSTGALVGEAAAMHSLFLPWLAILGALLGLAARFSPGGGGSRPRVLGAATVLALLLVCTYYDLSAVSFWEALFRWSWRAIASLSVLALALCWPLRKSLDVILLNLAVFGGAWFFSMYAPTYAFYIAGRHRYLPSAGACVLLAAVLLLPATLRLTERSRRLLEGAVLGLTACLCTCFYAACLREAHFWMGANDFISSLRQQILRARPTLPKDATVVILNVPPLWNDVPLLPDYALQAAVRSWYGNPAVAAGSSFVPGKRSFQLGSIQSQSYARLLLFSFAGQTLEQKTLLVFEDGTKIRVGASLGHAGDPSSETALGVIEGQPVL